jgi:hypothetical protein
VDYAINILRLGNSTGGVNFSNDVLPQGVSATFIPASAAGSSAILRFGAAADAPSAISLLNIKGNPSSASVGPSQRTIPITLTVSQGFTIYSVPEVNLSGCNQAGPSGSMTIPVSVIRQWQVRPPVTLSVEGLPANVSAVFSPASLNFPGNAIGDKSTLTFTVSAGVDIPDGLIGIRASNGTFSSVYYLDLHGMCPRHNKDFTIRGSFFSNHLGFIRPVQGAVVEIYRDAWGYDDMVGKTKTNDDGSFEKRLWANDEDTYYAKLKLNDETGVYLHGSWSSDIWDINSYNRGSNSNPVIDLGGTVISVDGGASTPKASIWQGSHHAYQEFITTTGFGPPTGDYEIRIWKGFISPITYLSTTEWPDNYHTQVTFSNSDTHPNGTDNFFDYKVNFHEFGHAIRHSFDGDFNHFSWDNTRFIYGRSHGLCDNTNSGFAFNEGWAEFWAEQPRFFPTCTSLSSMDFETEFNVAMDLTRLMQCAGKSRKDMIEFLGSRQNFIHSDNDFREQFKIHFSTDLSGCPPVGSPAMSNSPLRAEQEVLVLHDSTAILKKIESEIAIRAKLISEFQDRLRKAAKKSAEMQRSNTSEMDVKEIAQIVIEPIKIQGQIQLIQLLQESFQAELDSLKKGRFHSPNYTLSFYSSVRSDELSFDRKAREIGIKTLQGCLVAMSPYLAQDKSGQLTLIVSAVERKLRLLKVKTTGNINVFSLLKVPPAAWSNETVTRYEKKHSTWWIWMVTMIIVCAFIVYVLIRLWRR